MNNTGQNIKDFSIKKILVVDDEDSHRLVLKEALERAGFFCRSVENAKKAFKLMDSEEFDLVISDSSLPKTDGLEFLETVTKHHPGLDVIIMAGPLSGTCYVDMMDAGASDCLVKPLNLDLTLAGIKRIAREKEKLIDLAKTNQKLTAALKEADRLTREANQASRAKTSFLASMSHEIRTPLNGIVGYTDMLLDTPLDEEQKSFLKNARFSCDTLLSVVNDILDFSKVEAGQLTLANISFDPEVLCFEIIDLVRTKVDESKVELLCSIADSVPGQVVGDPHRFRQVLLNLLGNAVKFTDTGSIKLFMDVDETDTEVSRLTVRVQDTGIGIAKDNLKKIFEPFVQSEDDITNRYGGTGLGLAISKDIAKKMKGDVWAESTMNRGSTFYFTACFEISENKKVRRVRPVQLKGRTALLSTTSYETYKILFQELCLAGMEVYHVNFTELELFLTEKKDHKFDIAIIDFGKMAKTAVPDFIEKIDILLQGRFEFDFIACSIPVPGIADRFHKAGFKGFLPKPISKTKLFEMISYVIGMEGAKLDPDENKNEIVTAHLLSENKKHAASILLVEDHPVNQKMAELMLSKAGYMIDVASDGEEAYEKYRSSPDAYDLIFMDINMPKMNGFQATELIRSFESNHESLRRIPILALTANVFDEFKQKCMAAGMDDFLTKPIRRDLVFQAIQQWTGKRNLREK